MCGVETALQWGLVATQVIRRPPDHPQLTLVGFGRIQHPHCKNKLVGPTCPSQGNISLALFLWGRPVSLALFLWGRPVSLALFLLDRPVSPALFLWGRPFFCGADLSVWPYFCGANLSLQSSLISLFFNVSLSILTEIPPPPSPLLRSATNVQQGMQYLMITERAYMQAQT